MTDDIVTFDYGQLSGDDWVFVQNAADTIHQIRGQAIWQIGEQLAGVKARLDYGLYGEWLAKEFGWSDRTARLYVQVYEAFGSAENFSEVSRRIDRSAQYLLSAPSVPGSARDEALARAEAGERITHRAAQKIKQRHKAKRDARAAPAEALPPLSPTAQQKLDAYKRQLERDFEYRVRMEAMKWVNEVRIPIYEQKLAAIEQMLSWPRNAVMYKEEYNKILMCLHPDSLNSRTSDQLAEAFRIFTHYKPKMVATDEEERRRILSSDLPRTREELLARRRKP
jgi:hypothetical protein